MSEKETFLDTQNEYINLVAEIMQIRAIGDKPMAYIRTYGCQQNVADSETIKGMLAQMGYGFTDSPENADFILFNTCAVREHAEDRVFGNVGAIKSIKKKHPSVLIALCGCMMEQEHIAKRIYKSFPFVGLVFGTHCLHEFPKMLYNSLLTGKRQFIRNNDDLLVHEGMPKLRDGQFKGWLPIMYGCDNFCSYCIVPYVRGRERSREPEFIIEEAKQIIAQGYKDITLLGQNVNSYGKNNVSSMNFAGLLREINALPGDFTLRFMTSHPKDCTKELIDAMAECDKVAKHLHLPFQSGNDRVLKAMNRHYDRAKYLELVNYAKEKMPDISLTSDVIVGFPGETYEEFLDTVSLIKEVEFTSLFTFIYSRRTGTKAAELPDPVSREEKGKWFKELCDVQEEIAARRTAEMNGKTYRVLVEGKSKNKENYLSGRTDGNIIIEFPGDESLIGEFCRVKVTESLNWILRGELAQ